jgi:23S rRNA (uracil1939-C5)-methyltransferase
MKRGERVRLVIERPAAGGRMIARHDGAIVFVSNAIPGETVVADIEKVQRGVAFAVAREVLERSPDRIDSGVDSTCGGAVFAHIAYERQRQVKSAIIEDSMRRLGRIALEAPVEVVASPADGYRMRARLHMRSGRLGFFREGTHELCDAAATRQLRDDTADVLQRLEASCRSVPAGVIQEVEIAENIAASDRVVHLHLHPDANGEPLAPLVGIDGLTGATCSNGDDLETIELFGAPAIADVVCGAQLSRHVRSFFQGNRFLLEPFVEWVLRHVTSGPLIDLYAGVGLFSLAAAAKGIEGITAVEGDRFAARDLTRNAAGAITVMPMAVEEFVHRGAPAGTTIVDPPRTGLSKEALARVIAIGSPALVYVSCDIATLARDARGLLDAGYRITSARAFDLFPNTAHVETVMTFER